jgi:transcription elongation GreA/GreB family factor
VRVDKRALLADLRAALAHELERATRHALDAAEATTHEENRAESDKDMRSTETSYVARGQALRARDLEAAIMRLAAVEPRDFDADDGIETSALVEVEQDGRRTRYFIVPAGGGLRLGAVQTLATTSPLGRALLGLSAGDEAEVATPQGTRTVTILSVR